MNKSEFLKEFVDFWQRKGLALCELDGNKWTPSAYDGGTGNVENLVEEFLDSRRPFISDNRPRTKRKR